jgi:serine/threonine protein kinase/TolA-binding protein
MTAKMQQAQWDRLQDLFSKAVELSTAERDAFVSRETADDPELRKDLLELLECDSGNSTGPLTHALGAALDATSRERRKALVGKIIGNYRLVSVLGHGGTGTVYLAERADRQYSAQVAIKVVDTATVHGDLGSRFRAERQILASLNHPNIGRLLDAGETNEGQPYLVMEYIHGEQLDRYADRQSLNLHSRLRLFLEICAAVQYAHQNLVVHRDLKPANILVTSDGVPKLLDFGIAKLLDTGDAAAVLALTRMNDRLLTPEYASPEQILGQAVTTASDVYALGVVLYELLTGLRPYSVPVSASQLELERLICISDPERPSAAVRKATAQCIAQNRSDVAAIAQARALNAEKLHKRLQGDLDAIVMRALRKEPQHRYPSVEQLSADIRRHLDSEPVQARQGNWAYYSNRFVRRHAFGVSVGATFAAVGIAFMIVMSVQAKRIAAERDRATQESSRAETVSNFMLQVFSASDPFTSQGRETSARELLDNAAKRIRGDLNQQPEVRARLLEAIGKSYRRQNQFEQARAVLEEAVQLRKQLPDPDGSKLASTLLELAPAQLATGDSEQSQKTLQEVVRLVHQTHTEHSLTHAAVLRDLGRAEQRNGNLAAARKSLESSLALYRDILGPLNVEVATTLDDLQTVALWGDDLEAAEKLARQALDIYAQIVPELYPNRIHAETQLGEIMLMEGRISEARIVLEQALSKSNVLYGDSSLQVAGIHYYLAEAMLSLGRLDDAQTYAQKSQDATRTNLGEEHYKTAYQRAFMAEILLKRGKLKEAESLLHDSLETYSKTLPPDHQYVASSEYFLGEVLLREGRLADAEATLTASMNRWKRTDAAPWRSMRSQSALGEVLYREHKNNEAEHHLSESYRGLASDQKADPNARLEARERLVHFYRERGQLQKLQALIPTSLPPASVAVNK